MSATSDDRRSDLATVVAYLVVAAATLVYAAVREPGRPLTRPLAVPFLAAHGAALGGVALAAVLALLGLASLRAARRTTGPGPGVLRLVDSDAGVLGAFLAAPFLLAAAAGTGELLRRAGVYGTVRGGDLASLAGFLLLGALVLHLRRTVEVDPTSRQVVLRLGKPFSVRTRSFPFGAFEAVEVNGFRGRGSQVLWRVEAVGPGRRVRLAQLHDGDAAVRFALEVGALTGCWTGPGA
jgi:hypothetical protein